MQVLPDQNTLILRRVFRVVRDNLSNSCRSEVDFEHFCYEQNGNAQEYGDDVGRIRGNLACDSNAKTTARTAILISTEGGTIRKQWSANR